ncbi:Hypothetical predicted protein [Octopus vulgaris]|uniref:Uncharacterized protein n=1 Tax=Octopus vulgaris TaxID=6645 RepID=A0AA36ASJ3_OCTVU|nr:Hypothetical predicted protein [Octopus vulgaris]
MIILVRVIESVWKLEQIHAQPSPQRYTERFDNNADIGENSDRFGLFIHADSQAAVTENRNVDLGPEMAVLKYVNDVSIVEMDDIMRVDGRD